MPAERRLVETRLVETRPVEARTWPQRVDVHLVDLERGEVLAHYPLDPDFSGPVFDPLAPYAERAEDALRRLAQGQEALRAHWGLAADVTVALELDERMRDVLRETLAPYDLELEQLELRYLAEDYDWLAHLGPERLFALLVDWVDAAERHYPPGASLGNSNPEHWTKRSHPDVAAHFHHLVGLERPAAAGEASSDEAYERFLALVDVPLELFSLGYLLRFAYYHLTEFADREAPEPKALQSLRRLALA